MAGSYSGYERSGNEKTARSWPLRLFLLAMNLFLLSLILDFPVFRMVSLYIMIGTLLLVIFRVVIRGNKRPDRDNPRDIPVLIWKYLRINRKFMLASILGLLLAIMVISQIVILSNSTSGGAYNDIFQQGTVPLVEIQNFNWERNGDYSNTVLNISENLDQELERLASLEGMRIDRTISYLEYEFYTSVEFVYFDGTDMVSTPENMWVQSSIITEESYNLLSQFPGFPTSAPYSENFTMLTLDTWRAESYPDFIDDVRTNGEAEFWTFDDMGSTFTLPIEGVWIITDSDWRYAEENSLYRVLNSVRDRYVNAPSKVYDMIGQHVESYYLQTYEAYLDIASIETKEVEEVLQSLRTIMSSLRFYLNTETAVGFDVFSPVEWELQSYLSTSSTLSFFLLIISVPMLGVALYLVYFSLNLVEMRKERLVSIMKIRGISSSQLKFMLTTEAILASLIATVIGMAISVPWSQFVLSRASIFGVSNAITVPVDWIWRIPVIGVILAINLNIGSILSISSTTVEEGEVSEETREPFWRRLYLDVIFATVGSGFWIAIRVLDFASGDAYFFLVGGLGPISLLMVVIGLPLLISRYYSNFLTVISDFLWKQEGNLIALATRNLRKNKYSASKLTVLLMIGMMFSFVALSVPHSYANWNLSQAQFGIGADMAITNFDLSNDTLLQPFDKQDINSYSPMKSLNTFTASNQYSELIIMGVDPGSFAQTAHWHPSYADQSLSKLMDVLEDDKILIQEDAIDVLGLTEGSGTIFDLPNATLNAEVGASFKYWPLMTSFLYFDDFYINQVVIITSLDVFNNHTTIGNGRMLLDITDNMNHTQFTDSLMEDFDVLGASGLQFSNAFE
ncbi:MAG: FtsX-like permease family protein, partial [Candidatus Kariarchaeaceae archaeon]